MALFETSRAAPPRGFLALFDGRTLPESPGLFALIVSDYIAHYGPLGESPGRRALLFVPRMLANPSMHATAMMRIALHGPRAILSLWRTLLIAKHTIDIQPGITIGPGLRLPHPVGLTLGPGLVIGRDVTIYHYVSIGGRPTVAQIRQFRSRPAHEIDSSGERQCPRIEDEATIMMNSVVIGPITVGRGAVVGAESWLDRDLEAGAVHRGRTQP